MRRWTLRFANLELLAGVLPRQPGWPRHVPAVLLVMALLLLILGLAGPTANANMPRDRATVMLVIDVSPSMNSTDVTRLAWPPRRTPRSPFHGLPPDINLGVESFSGTPTVLVSPTTNRDLAVRAIQTLKLSEATATGKRSPLR